MAYLIIHVRNQPPQRMKLAGPTVVGRALGCGLWLDDSRLSRHHCRIEPRGDQWFVVDTESSHGTFIDGHRIREHAVHDGVTIEVGRARLVFREGDFVSNRPADPLEATTRGSGRLTPTASSDSTIGGSVVGIDVRSAKPGPQSAQQTKKAVSLAFTRPPAEPKVGHSLTEQGWFAWLLSRLRRR